MFLFNLPIHFIWTTQVARNHETNRMSYPISTEWESLLNMFISPLIDIWIYVKSSFFLRTKLGNSCQHINFYAYQRSSPVLLTTTTSSFSCHKQDVLNLKVSASFTCSVQLWSLPANIDIQSWVKLPQIFKCSHADTASNVQYLIWAY